MRTERTGITLRERWGLTGFFLVALAAFASTTLRPPFVVGCNAILAESPLT